MMNTDDLIRGFGTLGLSAQQSFNGAATASDHAQHLATYPRRHPHHEITYDFPALNLLQDPSQAHLPEPVNIDFRIQPDTSKYDLNQLSPQYCHSMNPNAVKDDLPSAGTSNRSTAFIAVLDGLTTIEGESTLSIATYLQNGNLQYVIRLECTVDGKQNYYNDEFDEEEFAILLSAQRPWIELLGDIVFRASARSCISAEVSMMAQDVGLYTRDANRWRHRWGSGRKGNVYCQLMMRDREVDVQQTDEGGLVLNLACGHSVRTTAEEIRALHDDYRTRLRCADCDDQAAWESLDGQLEQSTLITLSTRALLGILIATSRSFELPDVIVPTIMQHAHCEETFTALDIMCAWLAKDDDIIMVVPDVLRAGLETVCMDGLRRDCNLPQTATVPTPPGWTRFLRLWLSRAINFLIHRRCSLRDSKQHAGVHWHQDDSLIWWNDPRQSHAADLYDSEQEVGYVPDVIMS
ncbi:hypothetical protein BST61_g1526 [Cercospora zeina]